MSKKNKLKRYADVENLPNILQFTDFQSDPPPKREWASAEFGNQNPIILELACGKGHYTVELARRNPDKNFIGVDIKGSRLWVGAKTALAESLTNVRFLRVQIEHLQTYFAPGEIQEIWITFPDPFPKHARRKRRLTSPRFLSIYRDIAAPGCIVHLKTDSDLLYHYTLETLREQSIPALRQIDDVHGTHPDDPQLSILTDFEQRHLRDGRTIHYVCFSV